jgi:hypothetical protein
MSSTGGIEEDESSKEGKVLDSRVGIVLHCLHAIQSHKRGNRGLIKYARRRMAYISACFQSADIATEKVENIKVTHDHEGPFGKIH